MGKYLSAEQIFAADDIETEEVNVVEWGGPVLVRGLSGAERERWEAAVGYIKGDRFVPKGNATARLIQMALVEPKMSEDQVGKLGRKSSAALARVGEVAKRLSGIGEKDMEFLEGNSDSEGSGDSTSASPSLSAAPSPNSSVPSPVAS